MNILKKLFGRDEETPKTFSPVDSKYPDWENVKKDLSFLPKGLLNELQKAMVFIVSEGGIERAVVIIRAEKSEFRKPVTSTTPIRLHIDFYSGRNGDVFGIYPVILDDPKDPAFKETWLYAYDDRSDIEKSEPLFAEQRKRLQLLLAQKSVWTIFVNHLNEILWIRQVLYTNKQMKTFEAYTKKLDRYIGKTIEKMKYFALLQEYLNAVPTETLRRQFLQLF